MSQLKIGNVTLDNNLVLAPMAGVTDLPFRLLCKEQGAGLICMEMISAKAIYFNNKNTYELMEIHPKECPVSLQLFGSDPDIISEMAKRIEERPFAILDINMGCPVPKVAGNGEGSALMRNPKLVAEIVEKTLPGEKTPQLFYSLQPLYQSCSISIGVANTKTTAVRVIPAIGKQIGDELDFGGLLGHAPVMALKPWSPAKFIRRGGRIPAPIHSLKN